MRTFCQNPAAQRLGILMAVMLLLIACGGASESPTPDTTGATAEETQTRAIATATPDATTTPTISPPLVSFTTGTPASKDPEEAIYEYARVCGDMAVDDDFLENRSWAELGRYLSDTLEKIRAIQPPEELTDFHHAQTVLAEELVSIAKSKPQDGPADWNELIDGFPTGFAVYSDAVTQLDPEILAVLTEHGCFQ